MKKLFACFWLLFAAVVTHAQTLPSPLFVTQPVGTNSTKAATTAFVTAAGHHYPGPGAGISSNTTLSSSQINGWAQIQTFGVTATLPLASSVANGSTYTVTAGTAGIIAAQGSDTICGLSSSSGCTAAAGSINIAQGEYITLAANGSGSWWVIADSAGPTTSLGCANILAYGGNNGGSVDNSSAFTKAAAIGPSGQACVYFPPGTYAFSGNVAYSMPSSTAGIMIRGAGPDVSKLVWAANGGLSFSLNSAFQHIHVRDLSLLAGTTATGTAIGMTQSGTISNPANSALSDITNVTIHGSDGIGATNYWQNGIFDNGVSNLNIISSNIVGQGGTYTTVGTGINLIGTSTSQAVQINLVADVVQYEQFGIVYGTYTQGVTVTSSNFTGDDYGIYVNTPNTSQDQLTVLSSQFNCGLYAIFDTIGMEGVFLHGNYFLITYTGSTNNGVVLAKVGGDVITGNIFQRLGSSATGTNGLVVQGTGAIGAMVTGNEFVNLGTAIWVSAASNISIQSNHYDSNGTNTNTTSCTSGCTVGGGSP